MTTPTAGKDATPDGLDLVALASELSKFTPLKGRLRATLVSGGKSNLTYRVNDDATRWIVRRPPLADIPSGAHDVSREYRVMKALSESAVPVPTTRWLCTDPTILGAPFYVMDEVPGRVLRSPDDVKTLTEPERTRLGQALVDTIGTLHELDPSVVGLDSLGRADGYLQRQLDRWVRQYRQIKVRDQPAIEEIAVALNQHIPDTTYPAIVHGDYRLDNVIVTDRDPGVIAAVLDWEMATLGDSLADFATFLMFWDEPGHEPNPISAGLTALPGFPSRDQVIERYLASRRLSIDPPELNWYLAFAQFRLAVILEQIHVHHVNGTTRGEGFAEVGDMVTWLLHTCANTLGTRQ